MTEAGSNSPYNVEYEDETLFIDSSDWRSSRLLKGQISCSFFLFTLFGLAEQTVGAIIPKLQEQYHVNDIYISLIYFSGTLGYFTMALCNGYLHKNFGIRGVTALGLCCMTISYFIISTVPPFAIFVFCYFFSGLGFGAMDAGLNTWMGNLVDSNPLMGILHGCYGLGSMILPSLITHLLERKMNPWQWYDYYVALMALSGLCLTAALMLFRYETPKKYKYMVITKSKLDDNVIAMDTAKDDDVTIVTDLTSNTAELDVDDSREVSIAQVLAKPMVWIFATVLAMYVGGEVAFGQWLLTYLMRIKQTPYKKCSHIVTSFWSGLTVGRVVLGWVTGHYFTTELVANMVYITCSFGGYILIWWILFATDYINILFPLVFITGVVVGPIFPTTVMTAIRLVPKREEVASIGFITAAGGSGAAMFCSLIGAVAETSSISLFPLIIMVIFGVITVAWFFIYEKYKSVFGKTRL